MNSSFSNQKAGVFSLTDHFTNQKVLMTAVVSLVMVLMAGVATAATVEVEAPDQKMFNTTNEVNITFNYSGTPAPNVCFAHNESGGVTLGTTSNVDSDGIESIYNSSVKNGEYEYKVSCENTGDDTPDVSSNKNVFYVNYDSGGVDESPEGDESEFSLYGSPSTMTSYSPGLAFIGEGDLRLSSGTSNYTINDSSGETVASAWPSPDEKTALFDLAGAEEGRALVYDQQNDSKNKSLDLVSSSSDVVGRFASSGDFSLYNWLNGTEIDYQNNDNFNVSINSSWAGESLYRLNFTRGKGYFVGVKNSKGLEKIKSKRNSFVELPRVNDVNASGFSNISGTVVDQKGYNVSNLKLKIERKSRAAGRWPFMTAPPTKYNTTDSNGNFKFTGLQSGSSYTVTVVNDSYSRYPYMGGDSGIPRGYELDLAPNTENSGNVINVTNMTGNVSVKLLGERKPRIRYAFYVTGGYEEGSNMSGFSKITAGVEPGTFTTLTIPNGSYSIFAARVKYSKNSSFPDIVTDSGSLFVTNGSENNLTLGFPEQVKLNGTVKGPNDNPVEDVRVVAENRSLGVYRAAETDDNGVYEMRVRNSSSLKLTAEPGWDSNLKRKSKNLTVSGATEAPEFSLSQGPYIEGYVKKESGGGVPGVELSAWNGSVNSYGEAVTNKSGYFKIAGLEKDTNYSVFVEPKRGYDYKEEMIYLNGSNETQDITLKDNKYDLTGSVKDTEDNSLDATVTIRSRELDFKKSKEVSGSYNFNSLNSSYYEVRVLPDNSSYKDKRKYVYLSSDSQVSFELQTFEGVNGEIKSKNSGDAISDVYIRAYNYSEDSYASDVTGPEGNFQLDVSSVNHTVRIWPGEESNYISKQTTLNASDIESGSQDYELSTGVSLSGTVSDPGKKNFTGFISLYNSSENSYGFAEFKDGTYNVTGLKNIGYDAYLSVRDSDYSSRSLKINASSLGGTKDFKFGTNKGPKLYVKVENPTGDRVPNATVVAAGEVRRTDSNGVAKFDRQPNKKKVPITVSKPNYNTSSARPTMSNTTSTGIGGQQTAVNIQNETLTIENVRGQLVDVSINLTKNGENVSEAAIAARARTGDSRLTSSVVTDSDGNVTLEGILPGQEYLTTISAGEDLKSANITFDKGSRGTKQLGKYTLGYEVPE